MIASPCRVRSCPNVATDHGYCDEHQDQAQHQESDRRRQHDRQRLSSTQRGYDARWRKVRAMALARQPLCCDCQRAGRTTAATEVHHIDGNPRHNAFDNLMPLCKRCHSRRTLEEQHPQVGGR